MKKSILIIFFLSTILARGQYDYSERCISTHKEISSLRFENARDLLAEEKTSNPDNLVPVMLEAYMAFLLIIVGEDESDFDSLVDIRGERFDLLSKGDKNSPWYRSSIARLHLQWAFSRLKYGSYFNAARDIRKAYHLLEQNNKDHPGFLPDKVGLGIMHALIGTIPDNYRWVAKLFSMQGSVELGRSELLYALENADEEGFPYLKDEALFFLSFIDLNLQPDNKQAKELLAYYDVGADTNLMLVFSKSRILMQTAMNDEAIDILIDHPRGGEYYPFYYLEYLTGLTKLNHLDEDADHYFVRFTSNFKGSSYIKSAYQRLAWCALLREDTHKYYEYMDKVRLYGDDFTDGDKKALSDAESGLIPNICLLKARLLYDGGYYQRANRVLESPDCSIETERDKTEWPYRKGRIKHAVNELDEALVWYFKTIDIGEGQPYYFAANAALQIARIYEANEQYELAEGYFRKCISMPKKEYKSSINQKAKAGLNRLKDKRRNK